LGLAVCWPIFHSRVSTSVWTGFVLGFSHPTATAGSGNQKADEIAEADEFMALSLVVGRSWFLTTWINDLPSTYKGKEMAKFHK
jgi:hypothetical protein